MSELIKELSACFFYVFTMYTYIYWCSHWDNIVEGLVLNQEGAGSAGHDECRYPVTVYYKSLCFC